VSETTVRIMDGEMGPRSVAVCTKCGADAEWHECESCGGEGLDGHDCGEDCCNCLDPEDNLDCFVCEGEGGWWTCDCEPAGRAPGQEGTEP
jgi:hypothetical protein